MALGSAGSAGQTPGTGLDFGTKQGTRALVPPSGTFPVTAGKRLSLHLLPHPCRVRGRARICVLIKNGDTDVCRALGWET